MKKLLFLFLSVIAFYSAYAQQEHLTFKGIPIDGQAGPFVEKLKQQGFTVKQTLKDGDVVMDGIFANNDCEIFILVTPKTKTIWKIGIFNKRKYTNWSSIKMDYDELKNLYTQKYGNPSHDYHFFSSPYELGDGYEISALKLDKCTYYTAYDVKSGYISIKMSSTCQIIMSYEDALNSALKTIESEKEALEDI